MATKGINVRETPTRDDAIATAGAGVQLARFPFNWSAAEAREGAILNWNTVNRYVGPLTTQNVKMMGLITGVPKYLGPGRRTRNTTTTPRVLTASVVRPISPGNV